jgi:hypothetical protein
MRKRFLSLLVLVACSSTAHREAKEDAEPLGSLSGQDSQWSRADAGAVETKGLPAFTGAEDDAPRTIEWAKSRYARAVEKCKRTPPSEASQALAAHGRIGLGHGGDPDARQQLTKADAGMPDELNYELKSCIDDAKMQLTLDTMIVELHRRPKDAG